MAAIDVAGMTRYYGRHAALRGVDFVVEPGEVVGLLGPNGAGKSTIMKILTGFLAPTAGSVAVMGVEVLSDPVRARGHMGYLPESAPIYPDMRVSEYLQFVGRMRGLGEAERAAAIDRVLERCGLSDRRTQTVGTLSKGFRQRVGLAQAILHDPDILILDEPTSGLDPNQIMDIRRLIREIGAKKTVLLSTHILAEVQASCDRVLILHEGEMVADGPTESITRMEKGERIDLIVAPGDVQLEPDRVLALVADTPGVVTVTSQPDAELEPGQVALRVRAETDIRGELFRTVARHGLVLLELKRERTNLEEVFRNLTLGAPPTDTQADQPAQA
jgi:ABC-2 type transport system ATP-binding protein